MEFLISLLTDPRILGMLTVPIVCMGVEGYVLYKLFQKYDRLQEQRLNEWKGMVDDYNHLAKDVNQTLDTLLKVIGNKNGNGGSK